MLAVVLIVTLYPLFLSIFVGIDKLTGWTIADAFGKDAPR